MNKREDWSHNLRTPLTTIRLVVDLCLRKGDDLTREDVMEMLQTAMEQTRKLETAIQDVEGTTMIEEELDAMVLHEERAEPDRITITNPPTRSGTH